MKIKLISTLVAILCLNLANAQKIGENDNKAIESESQAAESKSKTKKVVGESKKAESKSKTKKIVGGTKKDEAESKTKKILGETKKAEAESKTKKDETESKTKKIEIKTKKTEAESETKKAEGKIKGKIKSKAQTIESKAKVVGLPKKWNTESKAVHDLLVAQFKSAGADYAGSADTLVKFAKKQKDDALYGKALRALLQAERHSDALALTEEWKKVTTKDISHVYAWALMMNNDIDLALNEINKKLEGVDDEAEQTKILLPYAQVFLGHWHGKQSQNMFARLYEKYPKNKMIIDAHTELLRWQGDIDKAAELIDKQLFNEPKNIVLVHKKSDLYRYSIRIEEADKVWEDFIADYPSDPLFNIIHAQYLFNRYDYAGSLKILELVNDDKLRDEVDLLRAKAFIQLDKFDDAVKLLDKGFLDKETEYRTRYNIGIALNKKRAFAQAKKSLEPLTKLDEEIEDQNLWIIPSSIQMAHSIYGLDGIGAGDKYLETLMVFSKLTPDKLLGQQIIILQDTRHKDIAYKRLNEFLKDNPNHEAIRYAHSIVAIEMGLLDVAIEDLRLLHGISPDDLNIQNSLGYSMLDNDKDIPEAVALIKKALFANPSSPAIVDSMGWAFYRQDQAEKGMPFFRYAYGNFVDGEVIGHYIMALHKQGKLQKAKALYQLEIQNHDNVEKINSYVKDILPTLKN